MNEMGRMKREETTNNPPLVSERELFLINFVFHSFLDAHVRCTAAWFVRWMAEFYLIKDAKRAFMFSLSETDAPDKAWEQREWTCRGC